MSVVIEFLGHAGSGKTFLATRLAELLGDQCVATEGFSMRLSNVLQFMTRHPGKLILIVRYVHFSRQSNLRALLKALRRVLVYFVKLDMAIRKRKPFVIISEGALKVFNDIRTTASRKDLAYETIPPSIRREIFGRADVVVFVFSSLEVVAKRLAMRENQEASAQEIEEQLTRIQGNFCSSINNNRSNIRAAMREHEFRLIEVDNGESYALNGEIENMAAELLRTSHRHECKTCGA
jgi:dephospho-CoA kinase